MNLSRAHWRQRIGLMTVTFLFTACSPVPRVLEAYTPTFIPATQTDTPIPATWTPSPLPTDTLTPTPTLTSTPAATPTFALLRGTVLEKSSCRYGPGAPYLYFTGLVPGSNLEIIGRRQDSQWVYVEAIGGHSPCWVKASLMEIKGNLDAVEIYYPDKAPLPQSPYYPPTSVTSAVRNGDQITVNWIDIPINPGDLEDEFMLHYIVEVWSCQNGQLVFQPLATDDSSITFTDQAGCSQPSHGRIFLQEKHGFAGPAEIPWPPFPATATSTP